MSSLWCIGDVKLLPEDVIYDILLWLPVLSLMRFKSVCKSWHALIDSCYFIKQHLHHHHHHYNYQTSMKDKKLIIPIPCVSDNTHLSTFLLTSLHNFEESPERVEVEIPSIGYLDDLFRIGSMATFDGVICMNYRDVNNADGDCTPTKYITSLFNPATKESRVLPKSSVIPIALPTCDDFNAGYDMSVLIGFGFDAGTNDYKIVRLFTFWAKGIFKNRVEVYALSSNSWRIIDVVLPVHSVIYSNSYRPFKNGTCYCWWGQNFSEKENDMILCFDFSTELFRTVNIPNAVNDKGDNEMVQLAIINDNIACISSDVLSHLEIWILNEYGNDANESWAMHIKVADFFLDKSFHCKPFLLFFSMEGRYIFYLGRDERYEFDSVRKYDLVDKATEKHRIQHFFETIKDHPFIPYLQNGLNLSTEFKESLVGIRGGNC